MFDLLRFDQLGLGGLQLQVSLRQLAFLLLQVADGSLLGLSQAGAHLAHNEHSQGRLAVEQGFEIGVHHLQQLHRGQGARAG